MTQIGAYTPERARAISNAVDRLLRDAARRGGVHSHRYDGWLAKTTSTITAGVAGTSVGTGSATPYTIDSSDNLVAIQNASGDVSLDVKNLTTSTVPSDTWVTLLDVSGRLVIGEIASVGTKSGIYRAPSGGIAAISGSTLGSATCDAYELVAGVRTAISGESETVYNQAAEAVAANAYIFAVEDRNGDLIAVWEDCE